LRFCPLFYDTGGEWEILIPHPSGYPSPITGQFRYHPHPTSGSSKGEHVATETFHREMEEEYYERTRVWPIMHIIAMRKRILDENPWVARNLYNAFLESKRRSLERLIDPAVSRYPLAWLPSYARNMRDMFGGDPFPYGIEENRPTWEQMALYTWQQGIAHRHVKPEEMFPQGMMTKVVI
jgi:hypothetical protein